MPSLFNYNLLKSKILSHNIEEFEDKMKILSGWKKNLMIIKGVNEAEIQSAFLKGIFGAVLGYKGIEENDGQWNLRVEASTEVDAATPDGILGYYSEGEQVTQAVIELKGPKVSLDIKQKRASKDYGSPVEQAFSYSSKYDRCKWVIVSNMIEIRLYKVGRSQDYYESFHMEELDDEKEFKKFHFLLCKGNLLSKTGESTISILSERTKDHIQDISIEFYNLYRDSRIKLFEELKELNPGYDQEILLEKAQKFLDRIIFICFCEDLGLLPTDLLLTAIQRAKELWSSKETIIWEEIKAIFSVIDKGSDRHNIPAYDGGLFEYDVVLDNLVITNHFFDVINKISAYDFNSDLDANILGHIFEQSISDIEEIRADIQDERIKQSRRKKEGIYYTPRHITQYIVENSLGQYLEDIRKELGEDDLPAIESATTPKMKERYRKQHLSYYREYEDRVRKIKVLDPACGSGAFLNQAFDFLLTEYHWIHEQVSHLHGEQITIFQQSKYHKSVLQNNLYGVDLNEESVEITKLSLWLKTANKNEPLAYLADNIKSGNTLIDDPEVAGNKAFKWEDKFPEIMNSGGFDIVIGNPPYIFARSKSFTTKQKDYYYKNYLLSSYQINTYILFIEKSLFLLKDKGILGFIVPNNWLTIDTCKDIRAHILNHTANVCILNIYDTIFRDADVNNSLLLLKKSQPTTVKIGELLNGHFSKILEVEPNQFLKSNSNIINISGLKSKKIYDLLNKINSSTFALKEFASVSTGLKAYQVGKGNPPQTEEMKQKRTYHSFKPKDRTYLKYIRGRDVKRYMIDWSGEYLKYGEWLAEQRASVDFFGDRILVRQIPSKPPYCIQSVFVNTPYLNDINSMVVYNFSKSINPYYLLGAINSRLVSFWFTYTLDKLQRNIFPQFKVKELSSFPIIPYEREKASSLACIVETMQMDMVALKKKKEVGFIDIVNKYTSLDKCHSISLIIDQSNYSNMIYTGHARKVKNLTVIINDSILTVYSDRSKSSKYELMKFEVKDHFRRQFIKLFLENLTDRQLEEINDYSGAILERVLQIKLPDYEKDQVIREVVSDWNSQQREISALTKKMNEKDREINQIVYEIYGLTEEEIKIIEGNEFSLK